jgi:WD40 repeat protein
MERELEAEPSEVALSDRFVAWLVPDGVRATELDGGGDLVLEARHWRGAARTLAIHDATARLAVAGWFDEVVVYDLDRAGEPEVFAEPGQTRGLLFLSDHPTLIVAKEGSVSAWRAGEGVVTRYREPGAKFSLAGWGPSGLLVWDHHAQRLSAFAYRSFTVGEELPISSAHLWAMAADDDGQRLVGGAADGQLHRFDLATSELRSVTAHTQGVTSLLVRGNRVVSGSDDKEIAVWEAGSMTELGRTEAHGSLVNYLFWEEASESLWSSSSDSSLAQWSWPDLAELQRVQVGEHGKAAFWIDSGRNLALVGTWAGSWHEVVEEDGWRIQQRVQTPSRGVYSVVEVAGADAVLLLGINPTSVWLYDLEQRRFARLADLDLGLVWALSAGPGRVVILGESCVASYRFHRTATGMRYELSAALSSDLGDAGVGVAVDGGQRVAAGSGDGRLLLFRLEDLPAEVMVSAEVGW